LPASLFPHCASELDAPAFLRYYNGQLAVLVQTRALTQKRQLDAYIAGWWVGTLVDAAPEK